MFETWIDNIFDYWLVLPLSLCDNSKSRFIRFAGLFWFFVWILPAAVLGFIPLLALICGEIFEATWTGEMR